MAFPPIGALQKIAHVLLDLFSFLNGQDVSRQQGMTWTVLFNFSFIIKNITASLHPSSFQKCVVITQEGSLLFQPGNTLVTILIAHLWQMTGRALTILKASGIKHSQELF